MDPPAPNQSAGTDYAALQEFSIVQDLSVYDDIVCVSYLQPVYPSNLAHGSQGLNNSYVALTPSQLKESDKGNYDLRSQGSECSVVNVPFNFNIPAEPQLAVVSEECSAVATSSENTSGSDVNVQAQTRCFRDGGYWGTRDVTYSSSLHPAVMEQVVEQPDPDFATNWELVHNNKDEQPVEKVSRDYENVHADLHDRSRAPNYHQNKVTGCHDLSSKLSDQSLSALQVHDYSLNTFKKKSMRKLMLNDFKACEDKHDMLRRCHLFKNYVNYSRSGFSFHGGKSPTPNRKGICFGLHLNSIVKTLPTASTGACDQGVMRDANIKTSKFTYQRQTHEDQKGAGKLEGVIPQSLNITQGYESSPRILSNHQSSLETMLNKDLNTDSRHGKRKLRSENNNLLDEFKENDSKRERTESDTARGCKRCKCSKSKCLKLYCDCFVAGIYCAGSCSCQGCSNKHEFKELVSETRQQILSRNPQAFSPKVIESGSELLPNNGNVIQLTPSAPRHKRGCKCKKSMCVKKYCECYQANVGCSDVCRCEGCQNMYGKRAGYNDISRTFQGFEGASDPDENTKVYKKNTIISQTDFSNLHYHEIVTQSLQCTQNKVSVSSSAYIPLRSLSLPDSSMASCDENFLTSPLNSDSHDILLSTSSNSMHQVSYEWESDSNISEKENNLQPNYNVEGSHNPSLFLFGAKCSASPSKKELKKALGAQLSKDRKLTFVGQSGSPTMFGQTTFHLRNDNGFNLSNAREDEPGILDNSTPVNAVNVRSPSRRRLSPRKLLTLHNLGSGYSNTLKSARKFILKSVPTSQAPPSIDANYNKEQE